ncbi:MAG: RNHCP domain-containing protein [Candidatus Zipacnadales bacterium]
MQERKNPYHGGNDPFVCVSCGTRVEPLVSGGQRNHCPRCLCSQHVDGLVPGDRAANCGGLMRPIGVEHSTKKGWVIIHRCEKCNIIRRNKAALDDPRQPDDFECLLRLAEAGPDRELRYRTWHRGEARRGR